MSVQSKTLIKKPHLKNKEVDMEEITVNEERTVEEGRKAYAKGDWKTLNQIKHALGITRNRTRTENWASYLEKKG